MTTAFTARLTSGLLVLATYPATAQKVNTQWQVASVRQAITQDDSSERAVSGAWRCSLDGKYYALTFSNGLRIAPVRSGQIAADIAQKMNKKGKITLEGQWHAGSYSGLMVIQKLEPAYVVAQMLVPAPGAAYSACTSRKSALLFSLGQPQPICNVVNVSWNRQPQISAEGVASQEAAQDFQAAYSASAQQSNSSGGGAAQESQSSPLVGVWHQVTSDYATYTENTIEIRGDGTYTQTKKLRITAYSGSPTGGGTHDGRWRANGFQVQLSGDGNFPPSSHNLGSFTKIR